MSGRLWGRSVGIILAVLSMIANFLFRPVLPGVVTAHHCSRRLRHLGMVCLPRQDART